MGRGPRRSRAPSSDWASAAPAFAPPPHPRPRCRLAQRLHARSRRREDWAVAGHLGRLPLCRLRFRLVGEAARKEHEEGEEPRDCLLTNRPARPSAGGCVPAGGLGAAFPLPSCGGSRGWRAGGPPGPCLQVWPAGLEQVVDSAGPPGEGLWFPRAGTGIGSGRLSPGEGRTAELWRRAENGPHLEPSEGRFAFFLFPSVSVGENMSPL